MNGPLGTRQLFLETIPVAIVLLFWSALAAVPHGVISTGFRYAGLVMALLYVVVRGIQLAGTRSPTSHPDDLAGLLRENVQVALSAGVWFLAALLASATRPIWVNLSIMGTPYQSAVDALASLLAGTIELLAFVFTVTGVATVVLYAIAVGLPRSRARPFEAENGGSTDVQADD